MSRAEAAQAQEGAIWIGLFGLAVLMVIKLIEGVMANPSLENRFSAWLSDRTIASGLNSWRTGLSAVFVTIIFAVSILHFSFPGAVTWLATFPTDPAIRPNGDKLGRAAFCIHHERWAVAV